MLIYYGPGYSLVAANIGEHVFQCHLGWVQAPKPYGQNGKRRLQELLDQGYLC